MSYFTHERPELIPLIPKNTKALLDVGCGAGTFGKNVKNSLGCDVWGIEPVEEPALEAEKVLDKVVLGLFDEALPQINRTFDVVCFNDVLEHMPNPWDALKKTKNLLNENGVVIASLPNILHYQEFLDILFKKDWKYEEAGIMDKTHLRFFTKRSIVRMFEECGYSVLEIKGLDPTPSKKMSLISLFTFGYFSEMRYPQFAVKAQPAK
jgi:2-polyprenyl-3-methyl-5-hydroxy-6-metoxy-1,4-benzoquinol methylase